MTASEMHEMVETFAWDALQQQARYAVWPRTFHAFDCPAVQESLESQTRALCGGSGISLSGKIDDGIVLSAVGEVFNSAKSLGLVMCSTHSVRAINGNSNVFAYQFTTRGIEFFKNGEVSLSAPGLLIDRVREVVSKGHGEPGVVPLVEEAQRCWAMGCLRAAMVLIGLASEEVCTGLLDQLCKYPSLPPKGGKLSTDWEKLSSEGSSFYTRWQSGLTLLESVKQGLRKAYGSMKPDWWKTWEPLPGAIQPYAEAVRIARNAAAHSVEDVFTHAQVGLLLASLPTMLQAIADLTAFLSAPPAGVEFPSFGLDLESSPQGQPGKL